MSAAFLDVIRAIVPGPGPTAILRAALHDGDAARTGWDEWHEKHGGPRRVLSGGRDGVKRILPLLSVAADKHDIDLEAIVRTCLRTAYLREEFRSNTYRGIVGRAFMHLRDAGIPFVVCRGAALAEHEYGDPALRHCHDCDVLMDEADFVRAAECMKPSDFSVFLDEKRPDRRGMIIVHETGLPIWLHAHPFIQPHYDLDRKTIAERSVERTVCEIETRVPAPDDMLLHILGHASTWWSRENLCWACDAWMTMADHEDLDWERFAHTALTHRLALPLAVQLRWFRESLDAPIPESIVDRFHDAAVSSPRIDREAALIGAATTRYGRAKLMPRATTLGTKLDIVKYMFAPAPSHLRWALRLDHGWQVPLAYVRRPMRSMLRKVSKRFGKDPNPAVGLPEFMAEGTPANV